MKKLLLMVVAGLMLMSVKLSAQQRICGTMDLYEIQKRQDPGFEQRRQDIEQQTAAYIANNDNTAGRTNAVITIPVVFHIVYSTASQNISDAQCIAQINQLNLDYARLNADRANTPAAFSTLAVNTNIQFCLAQRSPTGAATTGIERRQTTTSSFSTNDAVKKTSSGGMDAWPAGSYLNIWVCNLGGGVLGYAQFPGGAAATDGVVLAFGTVGSVLSPGTAAPYNRGRTATHEVGHWLNLFHIWGDDGTGCSGSDAVGDTPNQAGENYGCPAYPKTDACTSTSPGVMFMNYMDYTDDNCMNMFTAGQSSRMNALFATGGSRVSLTTSTGCTPVSSCAAPTALTVTNITGTGATISWTAASGATGYTVRNCISGTTTCTSTTTTGTSVALTGLTGGTAYAVSVTATCSAGTSTPASSTYTTLATSCGNPAGLAVSSITSGGATLSWTAVTGALSYNVQYKTSTATTWTTVTSVTASRAITGLSASTTYNWQVQAVCNGLSGTYVVGTNFTTSAPAACASPSGLSVSGITSSGATLSWTAVTGAASYNVQYKLSTATTWTTVTSTTASRAVTGLTASSTYNWRVQTVCTGATSAYVAGSNFTTSAASTTCSDTYESNNTSTAAKTIPTNTDIRALISTGSDADWFRFTTTTPNTNIRVTLTTLPSDYDMNLYNSSLSTILVRSLNAGTLSETATFNTTAASTYFIKVFPFSTSNFSATQCYTLRVNVNSLAYRLDAGGNVLPVSEGTDISMYPNPANEFLNINIKNNNRNIISIVDINGKQVLRKTTSSTRNQIALANLSSGVYMIKVTDESGKLISQQKFLKN